MEFFYFETTKKYIVGFASLFSNVHIQRINPTTQQTELQKLPISFGAKNKLYNYLKSGAQSKIGAFIPRIGFSLTSVTPDPERNIQPYVEIAVDKNNRKILWEGVPYIFNFEMLVWTKYFEDNIQVVEQICSQFNPNLDVTIIEEPVFDLKRDISISLTGLELNSDIEYDESDIRLIQSSLSFELKGYMYPPITDTSIIEQINLSVYYEDREKIQKVFEKIIT